MQAATDHARAAAPAPATAPVLSHAYAASGGLLGGEEVAGMLREHADQPLSQLARWIVTGEVVSVEWRSQTLIPLFQFDLGTMTVRPAVRKVLDALSPAFESADVAAWFVQPNDWLGGATPLMRLDSDLPAVVEAARADRFVATGWS